MSKPRTMFEKIWDSHVVNKNDDGVSVLYIDRHLVHEVTSPQAFEGLRLAGRKVRRPDATLAVADHNVPTSHDRLKGIADPESRVQVETLEKNVKAFGIEYFGMSDKRQGIVHIIGPEQGMTQPGMTIVCGDSHTSTHGAFGAVAFGIGTSEVEQVLATQTILQKRPKTMKIEINGELARGVVSKDIILYVISRLSASGATGYFVEYAGSTIESLSMEARMTICNMSIEMGARGGLIAPDATTFKYIKGREFAPKGIEWEKAVEHWKTLPTDEGASYDRVERFDASDIEPMITYGTNPGMGIKVTENVPQESDFDKDNELQHFRHALEYMNLKPGLKMEGLPIDYVFMGSCTNSRIEDLRAIASIVKGKKKAAHIQAFVIPGSAQVEKQARAEGLDKIFKDVGFELRGAGCSACLGMNEDKIPAGKYCISTSNRNFEGRQGPGARTFLASPLSVAAAAITGRITDPREFIN